MSIKSFLVVSLVTPLSSILATAIAADLYVDASNMGAEDGSQEHPFNTIQEGIDAALPPVYVYIACGVYEENLVVNEGIYLIGENRECVIVDGKRRGHVVDMRDVDNGGLRSLTLRNGSADNGGAIHLSGSSVATGAVFQDLVIKGNIASEQGGGIYIADTSPRIKGCLIEENTAEDGGGGGIYSKDSDYVIEDSVVRENSSSKYGDGLHLDGGSPRVISTVIGANGGEGVYGSSSSPVLLNCLVANNGNAGIYARYGSLTVRNCTVVGNKVNGISTYSMATPAEITNCIVWDNVYDDLEDCSATYSCIEDGDTGEGTISENPGIFGGWMGDYCLRPGSPCIDAGTAEDAPEVDMNGHTRVGLPDMGADEFGDSDSDMMEDWWEDQYGLDKKNASDGSEDPDSDGLDNLAEFELGSDPTSSVSPQHVYVDASNMGEEDGSQEHPFNTIQEAIDAAIPPAYVHIASGTYEENLNMEEGVCLIGGSRESVVVDGGGADHVVNITGVDYGGLRSLTIQNGSAEDGGGIYSGGTFSRGTEVVLEDLVIRGNIASKQGGGIYIVDTSPRIKGCLIEENTAKDGGGGGIYSKDSDYVIEDSVVQENLSSRHGDGLHLDWGSPRVIRTVVEGNGVGVYASCRSALLVNCLVANNGNSGIYAWYGSLTVRNCTVVGNKVNGISAYSTTIPAEISNCIVWDNEYEDLDSCSATYSCIEDGDAGEGNISEDPLMRNPEEGDYRLQPDSPCIDAGANVPGLPETDLDGHRRTVDGNADGLAVVDIGAFEFSAACIASPTQSGLILEGDTLRFAANTSMLAGFSDVHYLWDFGDGRSSTLKDPGLVTFRTPGETFVMLTVTVNQNQLPQATRTISVVADAGSAPDLAVTQLNLPGDLSIGQPVEVTYTVQNLGDKVLSDRSWEDAIYLSRDPHLDVNDMLLTSTSVSQNVAIGGEYTGSVTVAVPPVAEGAYHLLLSVDDKWEVLERHQLNNEFAVATDLLVPRLTDAVPLVATFSQDGDQHYFRIDLPSTQNILIKLNDSDDLGVNQVYVRLGELPTRGSYDYRASVPGTADQQILIPAAPPGTWYILAYGDCVPGDGDFAIEAALSLMEITSVVPDRQSNTAGAVLTISGAGFYGETTVEMVADDETAYAADTVEIDSFTQITASFAAGSAPVGVYTVRVSQAGGPSTELSDAFEILSGGEAELETNLIVPSRLGYHTVATLYVEYRNAGNASMPAPLLVLTATQNRRQAAFLTLQSNRLVRGFWTSAEPEGFSHSVQILASGETPGVLQPGESFRVPIYYAGWRQPWDFTYPQIEFSLGVLTADNADPVDWANLKEGMRPGSVGLEAWDAIWASFVSQVGDTWGDYVRMLDENAAYLGRLGQHVVDVGQLLAFEFLQADGLNPLRSLARAMDAALQAPGLPLVFTRSFPEAISQRFELGPFGRGWSHNWQYSLQLAPDGTVTILGPGGSRRVFQPDSRRAGSYFLQPGVHATLSPLGSGFGLRELQGTLYAFRSDGKLDYVEDPNGNRITTGHTGNLLTSLTHSSGQSLEMACNAAGRIQAVTDHLGRQTTFSYGGANEHLLKAHYYDGRTATYAYGEGTSQHALTSASSSCCNHRYFTYDAQGRLNSTHLEGNAQTSTFSYDAGKVTATDALGHASKFVFDHRGVLVKAENALRNALYLAFDDQYNLARVTDPAGRSYSYGYDNRGNLIQSTDPLGQVTRFAFSGLFNRLTSVADANGNLTRYAYTTNGNLEAITYADGSKETWGYDAFGGAIFWTNRRGRAINYDYDAAGRITKKTYADSSHVDYVYDDSGNLTSATDPTGPTNFTYDANDYLIRIDYPGGQWLEFTYEDAGRRASSEDQLGHQLMYHYDPAGRLESITDESVAEVVRYSYDAAGRLARKTLGNRVYTDYEYDAAGQLLHLVNFGVDDSVLSRFDYTYDSRGRRISMDTLDGCWTYECDDLGQLTHAVLASSNPEIPDQDLTYLYDAVGNRIRSIENGVTTEYTANNLNQYVRVGDADYLFDADGNLIQEIAPQGTTTYAYDDESKLMAVSKGPDSWEYTYDAFGNRVATTDNGTATYFMVDPIGLGNVVGEYDGSGNLIAHYDHGFGLLSRTDAAGNPAYYTFDAIGNVQQLLTSASAVANAYAYAPFGQVLRTAETIRNPFQFVGQLGVTSQEGLRSSMRSREYELGLGRFLSADPIGLNGGMNLYSYCFNGPTTWADPLGRRGRWQADTSPPPDLSSRQSTGLASGLGGAFELLLWLEEEILTMNGWEFDWQDGCWKPPERSVEVSWEDYERGVITEPGTKVVPRPKQHLYVPWEDFEHGVIVTPGTRVIPILPNPPTSPGGFGSSGSSGSTDPNTKIGPAGFGTSGFISPNGVFGYRVDFENEPAAMAPAQQVLITDQLGTNLDWATFQLTEIGFGDQLIVVPVNTQYFEANVPVSDSGTDFKVQIEAGIRLADGEVYGIFRSIEPATGLPPVVDIGFLPPEDGTGRGQGHISYIIQPKAGLRTGTEIRNVAHISFDNQPAIGTNQVDPHDPSQGTDPSKECLNTIDADPPASTVNPLPAPTGCRFRVGWSGDDIGAGIASYDIYVSDNGGDYVLWFSGTTEIGAFFDGELHHTYAFYSVAHDNVGHSELPPSVPDTTTTTADRPYVIDVLYAVEGLTFEWSVVPEKQYQVHISSDMVTWSPLGEPLTASASDASLSVVDPEALAVGKRFYKIEMLP